MSRYLTDEQKAYLREFTANAQPDDLHSQTIKKLIAELDDTKSKLEAVDDFYFDRIDGDEE